MDKNRVNNKKEKRRIHQLDGTLEDELNAARELCGLKPGQSFQDIEIPPEWDEYFPDDDDEE